jgi:hypothetical protein
MLTLEESKKYKRKIADISPQIFLIDLLFWSDAIVLLFVSLLDIQLHASIGVRVKTSFNDISAISWRSVLLVGETGKKPLTCRKSLTHFIT